ncbi:glycosyltransferase family 4 protein [Mycobacterium avium subsp. hominissuis]|uniref:glycosyltransferase n=2 Tax=Mycobacterium avium TaxID=1764 RepID=UPI000A02D1C3
MSSLRSVLLLCWRDTGHPQGGGSEAYLQRIGAQLAAAGIAVTLRTARYPGAPRRDVVDGVRISRAGGRYSVYIWALLAMAVARLGLGPLRAVRPDVVVDTQNGLPFLARLIYGRRVVVLVHHCHREQWPVAGPVLGRLGWFVESTLSPRLNRRNQYVTVSLPSARDLVALGVDGTRIAVVRNGLDEAPAPSLSGPRAAAPRVVVLSRLVPHKQIEDALEAVARLRPRVPGLHLDIVGDGWWRQRLVEHVQRLGIGSAVTFHGHVDDVTKHHVLQGAWVHLLPSRKEGWGLAVVEAAQHRVPTIGYRFSGGLSDSIVDEVTGILVDTHAELVDRLEQLLADPVRRDQLGAKAHTRSGEFSWAQSADAMRGVLEAVQAGRTVSGLVSGRG